MHIFSTVNVDYLHVFVLCTWIQYISHHLLCLYVIFMHIFYIHCIILFVNIYVCIKLRVIYKFDVFVATSAEIKRKNVEGVLEPNRAQNIGKIFNIYKISIMHTVNF